MYVSELIVFMRGNNILCIAEVLFMFINFMNSFISVYDYAYVVCVYACVCVFIYYIKYFRPVWLCYTRYVMRHNATNLAQA